MHTKFGGSVGSDSLSGGGSLEWPFKELQLYVTVLGNASQKYIAALGLLVGATGT